MSDGIKVVHTADSHLRDQQFGRRSRGQDFTDSLYQVVDIAMAHGAKYILNSGDLLNTKKPSSKNIRDLLELNRRLVAADIKFLAITGNHDKCEPSWVKVLSEETRESAVQVIDMDWKYTQMEQEGQTVSVFGVPDCSPSEFRAKVVSGTIPDADILMIHAPVREFAAFPMGEDALSVEDLPTDRFKAILMGDIHTHKYETIDGCLVGYPGSTEFCRKGEPVDKFVSLVTFCKDGAVERQPIPIKQKHKVLTFDIKHEEEIEGMLEEIDKASKDNPIVLIRKNPEFTDLFTRAASLLDLSQSILRVRNLPKKDDMQFFRAKFDEEQQNTKQPRDFVCEYFPEDTRLFELATALCDRDAKPAPMIEAYIDEKLRNEDTGLGDIQFGSP